MTRHNSNSIFAVCEQQVRRTIRLYHRYSKRRVALGPEIFQQQPLTSVEISFIVLGVVSALALIFTMQAEYFQGRNMLKPVFENGWMAAVIVNLALGLFGSYVLAELIPLTRVLTAHNDAAPTSEASNIDRLVDQIRGTRRRSSVSGSVRARRYGVYLVIMGFAMVTAVAIWRAISEDNWLLALLPPFYFLMDCVWGVAPIWLLSFGLGRVQNWRLRRRSGRAFSELEENWERVSELYTGAKQRFFEESPEHQNDPNRVPPVSPLAAFVINHVCHEDIQIPDELLNPQTPIVKNQQQAPDSPKPDPISKASDIFTEMPPEHSDADNETYE